METIVISYIPNGFFITFFFVFKGTPLNKLTYMRKCPRGARKVLLPPTLPLFQGLLFLYAFPSFYKFTHIIYGYAIETIYK